MIQGRSSDTPLNLVVTLDGEPIALKEWMAWYNPNTRTNIIELKSQGISLVEAMAVWAKDPR